MAQLVVDPRVRTRAYALHFQRKISRCFAGVLLIIMSEFGFLLNRSEMIYNKEGAIKLSQRTNNSYTLSYRNQFIRKLSTMKIDRT